MSVHVLVEDIHIAVEGGDNLTVSEFKGQFYPSRWDPINR